MSSVPRPTAPGATASRPVKAQPATPARWRIHYSLLVLLFVYAMSFTDRQIMGILIQPIKTEFGVSDTAMGLLAGLAFALFYSVLGVPMGRYADRANRRNFVAWCCAAWSAMTALCGLASGYWMLALARVGVAVGEAGGSAPSMSMIADYYPQERRARAMSVYALGPQLGILFGLALGGWIAQHYGWRNAFLSMSVPGVVAALLLRWTAIEPTRGAWDAGKTAAGAVQEPIGAVLRDLWASKAFTRISLSALLLGFAGYGIGIWTPAFLVRSHGMSLQAAGAVMGLLGGLAAVIGTLASGWMSDALCKRDARWRLGVPLIGCVLSLPLGLVFYMMPAGASWMVGSLVVPHAIGLFVLFSMTTVWWVGPVYAALSGVVAAHRRTTAYAVFNLALMMVGAGLGPLVVGALSDLLTPAYGHEALRWALAIGMSAYVLSMLALAAAIRPYGVAIAAQAVADHTPR